MWDLEADVVIAGYGGAGAAAAIAAVDAGATVIVLEKNPVGGGSTKYSGGTMRAFTDAAMSGDFMETLCDGTTGRDVIDAFVGEASRNPEWLSQLGATVIQQPTYSTYPVSELKAFPSIPGADGIGHRVRVKGAGGPGGMELWAVLARNVEQRNIEIRCSSPATELLVEKEVGVTGVVAVCEGRDVRVRARRAVILTCGGYEFDQDMHRNYLGQTYYGLGNPANTGDGIRLASAIGADLWHMNGVAATFGYKFPELPYAIKQVIPSAGFIYVDQGGARFVDETGTDAHFMWSPTSYVDSRTLVRTRIPAYVIFDEDTRLRGAVAQTGYGKISDIYQWSPDNMAEVRKGWIKTADNVGDLAARINVRPDQLQATVAQYNLQCVGGYDPALGRSPHTLVPIARPPYYAIEMWPCLFNTQGGPRRNARAQIIDVKGTPIKRLYSAGELGSLWHRNYPGAGNLSEALAVGRIAGTNAAAEQSASN